MSRSGCRWLGLISLLVALPALSQQSTTLTIVGSDTLAILNTQWASLFVEEAPAVLVDVQSSGSATAPPALAAGAASIGAMSRQMTESELALFKGGRTVSLTEVVVGYDSVEIVVHKENPMSRISLDQLERMFGETRNCTSGESIKHWSDLGVSETQLGAQSISLYGRPASSGTYGFFRSVVLCGGNPVPWVSEFAGVAAIQEAVSQERAALGYIGGGVTHVGVKPLGLIDALGHVSFPGDVAYPLRRPLYLYFAHNSHEGLRGPICEFAKFVVSDRGQDLVVQSGFTPLSDSEARDRLATVCNAQS